MSLFERFSRVANAVDFGGGPPPVPPPPRTWQGRPQSERSFHYQQQAGTQTSDAPPRTPIQRSQPVLQDNFVTRLLAQTDAVPAKTRSGGNHEGYLHLSSLIGICEREQAISQQHGTATFSSVSGPMKIIWAIGRAVEKHVRNGVIAARQWRGVYGKWQCRCRASTHVGEHPEHRTCPICNGGLNTYREPLLVSHEHAVVGSPDLTLIELGWFLATEIKSMTKDQFDALEAPLADHVLQALGYRHLYALMGFPVLDIVSVVYARKDFKFGGSRSVYKEYHVRADQWQGQVEEMFAAARRVKIARENGRLPERAPTCRSVESTRAKTCERCTLCFAL